jgi:hypothetical protein
MRFFAVALTLCSIYLMDWTAWMAILWSTAFVHYLLALFYSRKRLFNIGYGKPLFMAIITMAGGWFLYINEFSLLIYFGVHHVFNEVYLTNRLITSVDTKLRKGLLVSAMLLNACIYAVVLRNYPEISWINDGLLFGLLVASVVAFFYYFLLLKAAAGSRDVSGLATLECMGLVLVVISFFVDIRLNYIVLYHFIFWFFYPMSMFRQRGSAGLGGYVAASVGLLVLFVAVSPISPIADLDKGLSEHYFTQQFIFWSYLHITLSFIVSDAHPLWIRRTFNPAASY